MLHRYWFKFALGDAPSPLRLGCGITAYDETDARKMLHEQVFPACGQMEIVEAIEDVDVSLLDPGHVRPNMGSPDVRGIWFPLL